MTYYRKGRTTPRLRFTLSEEPSSGVGIHSYESYLLLSMYVITKQIVGGVQWVELVIIMLTSKPTRSLSPCHFELIHNPGDRILQVEYS